MERKFYSLDFDTNKSDLKVEVIGEYDDQKLIIGEFNPYSLKMKRSEGRKTHDILRLQDVYNFLISKELRAELEKEKLTGWKYYDIESMDFDNTYVGFQCIGKCGKPKRPKKAGFITGFEFNLNTWDGSDFFIPDSTLSIICTERAMKILKKRKIKNIELENLKTLEWYST